MFSIVTSSFFFQAVSGDDVSGDPTPAPAIGHCIWYGECGSAEGSSEKKLNCEYDGPAKPMEDPEGLELLLDLCPQFNHTAAGNGYCPRSQSRGFEQTEINSSTLKESKSAIMKQKN